MKSAACARTAVAEKMKKALVRTRQATVLQGGRLVLDRVDLEIYRGEIVTLIGPNGSGKTTLVRTVLGLIQPNSGSIERDPRARIGYAPQHLHIDATMPLTVRRFLKLAGTAARIDETLAEVGATAVADAPLGEISGGEIKRVLLARTLMRNPDLLVLDEPSAGVDVTGQSELYDLIQVIRDRHNCGVLLVSHDLHLVMASTDRVVCLNHHVCCAGQPEAIQQHPEYLMLFGKPLGDKVAIYTHHHDHEHDLAGHVHEEHNHG